MLVEETYIGTPVVVGEVNCTRRVVVVAEICTPAVVGEVNCTPVEAGEVICRRREESTPAAVAMSSGSVVEEIYSGSLHWLLKASK